MSTRPLDTSPAAWTTYAAVLDQMGGEMRLHAALEMSEAVRLIRLSGIRAHHPTWTEDDVMRHFISEEHGVDLRDAR